MAGSAAGSVGIILDSSVLVAFERRRFDFERFLANHALPRHPATTRARSHRPVTDWLMRR